ncbi:MAG: ABC transporter permease [Bacillota bacterium]|nr:ABC transporter permease [Bacillota bacterium]
MQVYKSFFKVIYKNLNQILIYVFVFFMVTILVTNSNDSATSSSFNESKINVVFINEDKDSKLMEGFKDYLNKNANLINIPNDTKKLQDALFFREAEYIIKVPRGFTEKLLNGNKVQIEKTSVPNSTSSIFMDNLINKYFNTVKTYNDAFKNMSQEELAVSAAKDLSQKAQVNMKGSAKQSVILAKFEYYYNYLAYAIFSILILGVCSVMMVFNDKDLKMRNICSPVRLRNFNFQMILGNISFAVITWFLMIFASFIMYSSFMFTLNGLLMLLNSLIFTLAALSISFLIANLIKSRNAMSAAANVVSLGSCFIGGVMVPQAFLGKSVLKIASFTPTYWYVKANNLITNLENFNLENLQPVITCMLITLGFAAAFLAVTISVIKQKRTAE